MLKGKYVNLRKVEERDLPLLRRWLCSEDFAVALRGSLLNHEMQERVDTMIEENIRTYGNLQYFVIENKINKAIGVIMFAFINWKDRSLSVEIFLGEDRSFGYGAEALLLASIYAFHHLNMHRISTFVNEFNRNMLGILAKISNFEGKLRSQVFHEGRYWDIHVFGSLRDEFEKKSSEVIKLGFNYIKTKRYY